jgi:hypothetical protein
MQQCIFFGTGEGVSQVHTELFKNVLWAFNKTVQMVSIQYDDCQPHITFCRLVSVEDGSFFLLGGGGGAQN